MFRINATRLSDGSSQFIYLKVLTTPEIGFSFNPYLNEFSIWDADQTQQWGHDITSSIISENKGKTVEAFTVTNDEGHYVQAILEIHRNKQSFMYKILEINYNGVVTITPEDNMFLTTFIVQNGELKHFFQYSRYSPDIYAFTSYDSRNDETTIKLVMDSEETAIGSYDGWDALGSRIESGRIIAGLLDTSDPSQPCCHNNLFCYNPAFCACAY